MVAHITTAVSLAILLVNLVGMTLVGARVCKSYLASKIASPICVVLILFFIEHFHGLGNLSWVWPLSTSAAALVIWKHFDLLRSHWKTEALFAAGFAYVFLWRFAFPNLDAGSEKLGDLLMIRSYLSGTRLPPVDAWFPPYPFDVYYSLQHYAAALLGRMQGLDGGTAYNLAFCVVVALTITAAGGAAGLFCKNKWHAALLTVVVAIGGTGASQVVHLMSDNVPLSHSMRFIGGSATPELVNKPFGKWLVSVSRVPTQNAIMLPAEMFSYLVYLGDYHPPMSGFLLLMMAILCIALAENTDSSRLPQALLMATLPLTIAANAWNLPPHLFLAATWIVYRLKVRKPLHPRAMLLGFSAPMVLLYPYLSRFGQHASDYDVAMRLVSRNEHAPPILAIILFHPVLLVLLAQLFFGERKTLALWLMAFWVGGLLLSEIFYVDDIYGGKYNRFNTTLKWWPWLYSGALLTIGAFNLNSRSRICRWGTIAVLLSVSLYGVDLWQVFVRTPKIYAGRLDGAAWITRDRIEGAILEYLKAQPPGITLQRMETDAFTYGPGLALFSGQQVFLGWPAHERLWRGRQAEVDIRSNQLRAFYRGELQESAQWLIQNKIEHVLWLKGDNGLPPGTFEKIQQQISGDYYWREFYAAPPFRVGVWSRRVR